MNQIDFPDITLLSLHVTSQGAYKWQGQQEEHAKELKLKKSTKLLTALYIHNDRVKYSNYNVHT